MSSMSHLGCGDSPCAPCQRAASARRLGAVVSFNPADIGARFAPVFGINPDIAKSAINTAVGISTPVSPQDAAAFAHLTELAMQLQSAAFSPDATPEQKARLQGLLKAYSTFTREWNAAQRDPDKLRVLIGEIENALASAVPSAGGSGERVQLRHLRDRGFFARHAVPLAVGGALIAVGVGVSLLR